MISISADKYSLTWQEHESSYTADISAIREMAKLYCPVHIKTGLHIYTMDLAAQVHPRDPCPFLPEEPLAAFIILAALKAERDCLLREGEIHLPPQEQQCLTPSPSGSWICTLPESHPTPEHVAHTSDLRVCMRWPCKAIA